MSQRWPPLHRRASGLESMAALRHAGLRYGAGKHTCKVDRSPTVGEGDTGLRRTFASKSAFSSMIAGGFCAMPCCLKQLGSPPYLGTGKGVGYWSIAPEYGDGFSLRPLLTRKRQIRCQRIGGKYFRLDVNSVAKLGNNAAYKSGLRYIINLKHFQSSPFLSSRLSNLATLNLPVWRVASRSLASISNQGPGALCISPSCEEASVGENASYTTLATSNFPEDVPWREVKSFNIESLDGSEQAHDRVHVQEGSRIGAEESLSDKGVDASSTEVQSDPTVIVFDLETTGYLKSGAKIVELACRDLAGGERSTLETLVNPCRPVPLESTAVHKITSEMVNRDDVPSWTEVMTAFIDFVESRRKGDGQVILVAHNGRRFDVPFIMKECHECSMAIPSHWYFVDTIGLAKTMLKKRFGRIKRYSLEYLYYDCYNLPRLKAAHRAGVDVDMLASVFGKLLMDLEIPVIELLDQAFQTKDIELKPELLLREYNDRYTSSAKEVDAALLQQSMADSTQLERALGIELEGQLQEYQPPEYCGAGSSSFDKPVGPSLDDRIDLSVNLLVQTEDIKAAVLVTSVKVQSNNSLDSSSRSIGLSGGAFNRDATTDLGGKDTCTNEFEEFEESVPATASKLSGGEVLGTSSYNDAPSTLALCSGENELFHSGIQSSAKADHLPQGSMSATADEEFLGLTRRTAAVEGGTMSLWEDKFGPQLSEDIVGDEYEDALGLVLGNHESLATSIRTRPRLDEVKEKSTLASSLFPITDGLLQDWQVPRTPDQVADIDYTLSNVILVKDLSLNNRRSKAVDPMESSSKVRMGRVNGIELSDEARPLSQAAGDGTLQPLNLGGTLLKKKKGKRRGTGDVQTTAIRNIAHTVADCEEHLSVVEAAVLEIHKSNVGQSVEEHDISGSQHSVEGEKNRGTKEQLHTSNVNMSLLSPMMKQYVETKRQRPKFLLLSRVGDFYEAFFEDAERLAHACNIRLSAVDGGKLLERKVPMSGVPSHKVDVYLRNLLSKGIAVVKQDQVTLADAKGGTMIERQVSAVLTPGTLLDEGMLDKSCNNFLVAIFPHVDESGPWGLAYSDISTGEFQATQGQGRSALLHELLRLQPSEVIFPANVVCITDKKTGVPQPFGMPSDLCYSSRPTSEFFPAAAEKRLQSSFGEESLGTFGLLRTSHAIRAAGGLLGYVQETQKLSNEEIPLQKPSYYSTLDSMHMDDTVRSHLELLKTSRWGKVEGSVVWALDHTQTAMGGRLLRRWLLWPLINHDHICTRQDAVEVFVRNHDLRAQFRSELAGVSDIERIAARIAWKRADARDLLTLALSIQNLPNLAAIIEGVSSNVYFLAASQTPTSAVQWANKVEAMLVEELGSGIQPGRVIKEGVDETLDELRCEMRESENWLEEFEKQERKRTGIPSLEVGYNKNMGHYISIRKNKLKEGAVPDDYQKLQSLKAEERFVTPPLLQCETSRLAVESKVHDREDELLISLKEEIMSFLEPVREYTQALAALDVLSTFADLAGKRNYCRPHMLETGREITIVGGRHPVVEISLPEDSSFVPNSVYLGCEDSIVEKTSFIDSAQGNDANFEPSESDSRVISRGEIEKWWPRADLVVLTGPNASGKSCYLRQLGLIQLLAQAGSFVPATFTQLSVADGLYTRVGAVDDLAAGQSTFQVEMVESANILNRATAHSLVLLDEVGRGTSSEEGGVIARAVIEYLSQKVRARTIFSTHYHNLHVLDQLFPNIANYYFQATELEDGGVIFDHAVMPGFAVKSYAIAIGRGAGLPDWVCNRAAELLALRDESTPIYVDGHVQTAGVGSCTDPMVIEEDSVADEVNVVVLDVNFEGQSNSTALPEYSDDLCLQRSPAVAAKEPEGNQSVVFERSLCKTLAQEDLNAHALPTEAIEDIGRSLIQESSSTNKTPRSEGSGESNPERKMAASALVEACGMQAGLAEESDVVEECEENWSTKEQLDNVWEHVCAALQNQPATQALTRQKGLLVSIRPLLEETYVCMGASALFVRKFQQPEHAAALESAFASVLKQPIHLSISVLSGAGNPQSRS